MKLFILSSLIIACFADKALAQTDSSLFVYQASQPASLSPKQSRSAVYFQLGGTGFMASVVYDRRLSPRPDGLGLAVGIGGVPGGSASAFTFPLAVNYIVGEKSHYGEIAVGTTYTTGEIDLFVRQSGEYFFHHLSVGYRYQPLKGGLLFRGGLSPLFFPKGKKTVLPYLCFGISF